MYYVYILQLTNLSYYVGFTQNLKIRIKAHNAGKVPATTDLRPATLKWYCAFSNKKKALGFESYLKSGSGTAFRHKRLD